MPSPFYSWHIGTLVDGRITNQIPVVEPAWSSVMDDAGTLTAGVALSDPDLAGLNLYSAAEPCRCFLAVAYNDEDGTETFLEGGPIWSAQYDTASQRLSVAAGGLWSLWDHRMVLPVLAAGVNPATVTSSFTAALGTIAKQLVALALTHTGGSVPVVLPADEAGTDTRAYAGYEMTAVGKALRDLSATDGGPEIKFVPRRKASDTRYLEWAMRVGTAAAPLLVQSGSDWIWDQTAPLASLTQLDVTRDGTAMADRWWMQGDGSDVSTMFGRADDTTLTSVGFPLLEATSSAGITGATQSGLTKLAQGALKAKNRPVETWTLTVKRDEDPKLGTYGVGDWLRVTIAGDPYIPAGTYRRRITAISGDGSTDVTVETAAVLGGI